MSSLTPEDQITLSYAKAQTSNALMKDMVELVERLAKQQHEQRPNPVAVVVTIAQGMNKGKQVTMLEDIPNGTRLFMLKTTDSEE